MNKLERVAVYGSLRQGHGNWRWLLNREPVETSTLSQFKMYSLGGFPGVLHSDSEEDQIVVEVYEADEKDMESLDRLEGYREHDPDTSMYVRERVEGVDAWIYVWNGRELPEEKHVASGDWTQYVEERAQG